MDALLTVKMMIWHLARPGKDGVRCPERPMSPGERGWVAGGGRGGCTAEEEEEKTVIRSASTAAVAATQKRAQTDRQQQQSTLRARESESKGREERKKRGAEPSERLAPALTRAATGGDRVSLRYSRLFRGGISQSTDRAMGSLEQTAAAPAAAADALCDEQRLKVQLNWKLRLSLGERRRRG